MALAVAAQRLGIAGVCDMVEFPSEAGTEVPFPVEYKRGKPKLHRADAALRAVFALGKTPPPTPHESRCRACSLVELCRPEVYARPVLAWRSRALRDMLDDVP